MEKAEAIRVRVDAATLDLMEQARAYVKLDKSKFIRESIREKATAIVADRARTHFTPNDWRSFFAMIDNPPDPTDRMRRAVDTLDRIAGDR